MTTIATYNILHGYHTELILSNIKILMRKGATIICLQEAEVSFEQALQDFLKMNNLNSWKVEYVHIGIAGNLAFMWNSFHVTAKDFRTILLPTIEPVFIQKIKGNVTALQRVALLGEFTTNKGKSIRISNVHLAWEGGNSHRMKQLAFLKNELKTSQVEIDIIAGDFNTFLPAYFYKIQQKEVQNILGKEYINALPDQTWTCDIGYTAPQDKWETIAYLCKTFRIKLRSKLDYIFVRGQNFENAEMLDLPGSDHRPLMMDLAE